MISRLARRCLSQTPRSKNMMNFNSAGNTNFIVCKLLKFFKHYVTVGEMKHVWQLLVDLLGTQNTIIYEYRSEKITFTIQPRNASRPTLSCSNWPSTSYLPTLCTALLFTLSAPISKTGVTEKHGRLMDASDMKTKTCTQYIYLFDFCLKIRNKISTNKIC